MEKQDLASREPPASGPDDLLIDANVLPSRVSLAEASAGRVVSSPTSISTLSTVFWRSFLCRIFRWVSLDWPTTSQLGC